MNADDTFELLTQIAAYDQRTIGDGDVHAWKTALDDVPLSDALDAVDAFQRSERALQRRIIPADVVQWVAWKRRGQVEREHTDRELSRLRALPPAGVTGVWDGRPESASLRELWDEVLPVGCPPKPKGCSASVGERCVNPHTGKHTKIPHPGRMRRAALENVQVDAGSFSSPQ